MIKRLALRQIREVAAQFQAVLVVGSRQCGKTTLATNAFEGEYFDLEKPSDLQVFLSDIELALREFKGPLIIDEAQTLPNLFPVLRALIDERRGEKGQYYLLGSVNPALLQLISESLAGRVGIVELTPILYAEAWEHDVDLSSYWLRGGYPDVCLEQDEKRRLRWQESYARTFVERDVPRQSRISSIQMRRLMGMLAHYHSGIMNASELGRSLGVSYHAMNSYLDIIEAHFLIRRLPPYFANIGKRLVKSPKIYIRDSGMLHYLLGVANNRQLLESPKRGGSFESLIIEQIIAMENLENPGSDFFYYRTHSGSEVDLIVDRRHERIGFEFKCAASVGSSDSKHLKLAIDDNIIDKGYLIYLGERAYPLAKNVHAMNANKCLLEWNSI